MHNVIKAHTRSVRRSFVVDMSCRLLHPFTAVVAGPTSSGKSRWILRLIDNVGEMIEPSPSRIWSVSYTHLTLPTNREV